MSYFFLFLLSLSFLIVNYPLFILAIVTCTPHLLVGGRGEHVELEVLREGQEPGAGCLEQCLSDHLCFLVLPCSLLFQVQKELYTKQIVQGSQPAAQRSVFPFLLCCLSAPGCHLLTVSACMSVSWDSLLKVLHLEACELFSTVLTV